MNRPHENLHCQRCQKQLPETELTPLFSWAYCNPCLGGSRAQAAEDTRAQLLGRRSAVSYLIGGVGSLGALWLLFLGVVTLLGVLGQTTGDPWVQGWRHVLIGLTGLVLFPSYFFRARWARVGLVLWSLGPLAFACWSMTTGAWLQPELDPMGWLTLGLSSAMLLLSLWAFFDLRQRLVFDQDLDTAQLEYLFAARSWQRWFFYGLLLGCLALFVPGLWLPQLFWTKSQVRQHSQLRLSGPGRLSSVWATWGLCVLAAARDAVLITVLLS